MKKKGKLCSKIKCDLLNVKSKYGPLMLDTEKPRNVDKRIFKD